LPVKLEDIAAALASGYPDQDAAGVAAAFAEILRIVLPALTEKAGAAPRQGSTSVEEVRKAIRGESEAHSQAAPDEVGRLKVLYVASKFMNQQGGRHHDHPGCSVRGWRRGGLDAGEFC